VLPYILTKISLQTRHRQEGAEKANPAPARLPPSQTQYLDQAKDPAGTKISKMGFALEKQSPIRVEVVSAHDGLRLLSNPLRLEPVGGAPCLSPWRLEKYGSTRWLSADDGTRLSLIDGVETKLCASRACRRCVTRGSRNHMRVGSCKFDFEPIEVLPVARGMLSETTCRQAPTLWRAYADGQLLPGLLAVAFVVFCWLSGRRQQRRHAVVVGQLSRLQTDSSQVRLAWRGSRDVMRGVRLVSQLRMGTHVAELRVVDSSGKPISAWEEGWLRLAEDHGSIVLTPPAESAILIRHRISLTDLKQLRFGERTGATTRTGAAGKLAPGDTGGGPPWRCLHLAIRVSCLVFLYMSMSRP